MNANTLTALKGSIKKWDGIVKSTKNYDAGTKNCPLCQAFYGDGCDWCPVAEKTGESCCRGTPYKEWCDHQAGHEFDGGEDHRRRGCAECLRLAKAELAFLRSLLPKGEKP